MSEKVQISKSEKSTSGSRDKAAPERKEGLQGGPEIEQVYQAIQAPVQARPEDILALQQRFGNETVQRVLSGTGQDGELIHGNRELKDDIAGEIHQQAGQGGETL